MIYIKIKQANQRQTVILQCTRWKWYTDQLKNSVGKYAH